MAGSAGCGAGPRYLIVNAEEGEPGIYKDRHMMEGSPFLLLEGLAIAAYAIGAEKTYLYINGEANAAAGRIENALEQARNKGLAGDGVLGSDFNLDIEVRRGGGGYILGEESALMNSIEGQRNVPRTKPPFPVESGLWGKPTVINNVETLCNLPMLLSDVGAEPSPGTKLVSLSGRVRRPGLVEVPMGATVREIVFDIGGGPPDGSEVIGVVAGRSFGRAAQRVDAGRANRPRNAGPRGGGPGVGGDHRAGHQRVAGGGREAAGGVQCGGVVLQVHTLPRGDKADAGRTGWREPRHGGGVGAGKAGLSERHRRIRVSVRSRADGPGARAVGVGAFQRGFEEAVGVGRGGSC